MCGIAGYVNIANPKQRETLVRVLGLGVDTRGGHAIGYVSTSPTGPESEHVNYGRQVGTWMAARKRFVAAAASGTTCLLHARFATHANQDDVKCAHPFAVQRNGRTVLWGVHNGSSGDAGLSAAANGRKLTVDSLELFELMADNQLHTSIGAMGGWGVLAWIEANDRSKVYICIVSDGGSMHVSRTAGGGLVYGSTKQIVSFACDSAGLSITSSYTMATGVTYAAMVGETGAAGLYRTDRPKMTFAPPKARVYSYYGSGSSTSGGSYAYRADNWDTGPTGLDRDDDWKATMARMAQDDTENDGTPKAVDVALAQSINGVQVGDDIDAHDFYDAINADDFDRAAFLRWLEKNSPKGKAAE